MHGNETHKFLTLHCLVIQPSTIWHSI